MDKIREKHLCHEDMQDKTTDSEKEKNILSVDEFMEMMGDECESEETSEEILPAIVLDLSNIYDCQINKEEFQKGLDRGSELLGFITAIKQGGVESEVALAILLNEMNVLHNIETAKINKDMSIAVADKQSIMMDKNML